MEKMTSFLVILAGCWVLGGAIVMKNDTYVDIGLYNRLFTDDITFESTARSVLECSVKCSQQSCVTFTFHENTCRGHGAPMTFCSLYTTAPGARSFAIESKVKKEVKRLTNSSLALDVDVYYEGDWLVFQKRQDGSVNFYRNWTDYVNGFGDAHGEFWLGLDILHRITTSGEDYELRVELMKWDGTRGCIFYSNFSVGPASDKYRLHYGSFLGGDGGDSLRLSRDMMFSTKDSDNDLRPGEHCAISHVGAWWYKQCSGSNLNGLYGPGQIDDIKSIYWVKFNKKKPLKSCQMMIKPEN